MHSVPSGSDGNIDINWGVSQKPHVVIPFVPPPLGNHEGEFGSMGCCCSLVSGPTPHNGVGCGCSEGPASICSPTSYPLPGHLHEPPAWPSHLPAGPQTRGKTPPQSPYLWFLSVPASLRLFGLESVMGSDWEIGSKKWEEGRAKEKIYGEGTLKGSGVEMGSMGTLVSYLSFCFFPQCELSALEGMKACMTYFPRACGSLKVSICGNSSCYLLKPFSCLNSDSIAEVSKHLLSVCSITSLHSYIYTTL